MEMEENILVLAAREVLSHPHLPVTHSFICPYILMGYIRISLRNLVNISSEMTVVG